ncbi:hypothetical protein D3C86_1070650 [compost metagenome]
MVEQQQRGRLQRKDLATQLGTDRPPRAGHQNSLARDAALKQVRLRRHGVTSQQVGDVHFLDVFDLDPPTGEIGEVRHAAHVKREALEKIENLPAPRTGGRRQSQQDLLSAGLVDHLLDMLGLVNLQPGNRAIRNARIVVNECYRPHHPAHAQCRHQLIARHTGPIDGDLGQAVIATGEWDVLGSGEPVAHEVLAHTQTQAPNDHQAQPPVVENDRAGNDRLVIAVPVDDQGKDQGRKTDSLNDGDQRVVAKITHYSTIHAETNKQGDSNHGGTDKQPEMHAQGVVHVINTQTHDESQP